MKGEATMTVPEIAKVLGTRAALGIGLGLLLADRVAPEKRRAVGWTLLLAGAFVGGTLAFELFGPSRPFTMKFGPKEEPLPRPPERTEEREVFART